MASGTLSNYSRKSLSGCGTNEGHTTKIVAEVKHVKEAPNPADRRIEIKLEDKSARTDKLLVDAERRIAESLRLGRRYELVLTEGPNRGNGSAFSSMKDVKRLKGKPVEVSDMGGAGGSRSMGDRFGKGFGGSHIDFM